ncbi:hypothetical protein ACFE04_030963 [Oxalis oulophora]
MVGIALLSIEQLHILSDVVYQKEANKIQDIPFKSENERVKYLAQCRSNHETITDLLNTTAQFKDEFQGDQKKSLIAHDIFEHTTICCNLSLQMVRNYTLRTEYLKKIKASSIYYMEKLKNPNRSEEITEEILARQASADRNEALNYARSHQSPASRAFSQRLKEEGLSFEDLLDKYAKDRFSNYKSFKELEDIDKLEVYEEIIKSSGRGRSSATMVGKILSAAGVAVLLFTAAMMVWDIFTAEHHIETAVRDAVIAAATVGGAILGEFVGVAAGVMVAGVGATFVIVAGIALGFVGAFFVGEFAGWLMDYIFSSGGQVPSDTNEHIAYVAEMPDGLELAREILHG